VLHGGGGLQLLSEGYLEGLRYGGSRRLNVAQEPGSEIVEAWAADDTVLLWISDLARTELHSALVRKVREGEVTEEVLHEILECFRVDLLHRFHIVPLTARIVESAIDVLIERGKRYPLRALNALQLAPAQAVEGGGLIFVTADSKLTAVASVVFSQVLNPEVGERDHGMR
jgi:predicted nucleic acid-binding protein